MGLRPQPGSPLLEGGVDVSVSYDWAGAALEAGTPPSIGVFQEAVHAAMQLGDDDGVTMTTGTSTPNQGGASGEIRPTT